MPITGRPRAKARPCASAAGDAQPGERTRARRRTRPHRVRDRDACCRAGVPASAARARECRLPARALERRDLAVEPQRDRAPLGGGFDRGESHARDSSYTRGHMKEHSIAVIPGDGIGREVMPEGVRVLEAVGAKHGLRFKWKEFDWSCDWYKAHGKMCPDDAPADPAQVRRDLLRRGRQPGDRARPHLGLGPADQLPPLVRPVRQPAPGAPVRGPALPARRPQARRHRLHRDPREHRGRVRQRRRPHVRRHRARSRDAAVGLQPQGRRPHHEVRLRAGEDAQEAPHLAAPSRTASRSPCRTGTSASPR